MNLEHRQAVAEFKNAVLLTLQEPQVEKTDSALHLEQIYELAFKSGAHKLNLFEGVEKDTGSKRFVLCIHNRSFDPHYDPFGKTYEIQTLAHQFSALHDHQPGFFIHFHRSTDETVRSCLKQTKDYFLKGRADQNIIWQKSM